MGSGHGSVPTPPIQVNSKGYQHGGSVEEKFQVKKRICGVINQFGLPSSEIKSKVILFAIHQHKGTHIPR